jgi:hypothetical protein
MTQEEKDLLLKDLCARLPYRVIVHINDYWDKNYPRPNEVLTTHSLSQYEKDLERWNIKPYLRPMSSMTEEEKEKYYNWKGLFENELDFFEQDLKDVMDWLNSNHFDYRGLIEKGLAFEAPEGMYN